MRPLLLLFAVCCTAMVSAQESVPALRGSSDAGQGVFERRVMNTTVPRDTVIHDAGDVEVQPVYPEGDQALLRQLGQAPDCALSDLVEACYATTRVLLSFVVERDGRVSQVQVEPGVCPDLMAYARCAAKGLGRFTPGRKDGHAVRVRMRIPMRYELR